MDYSDISSLILFIFLCLWIVLDYFFECSDASSFTTTATASTSSGDINIEVLDRPRRGGSTTSTANTPNVDINIQVFDRHGGRRTTPAASHGDINIEVVDRRRGGGRTTTTTTTSTTSLGDISNQRLDRGVLSKLPTFDIDEETKQQLDECSVCLMEFEDGEKARRLLPCSHCFHVKCIDMWLDSHSTCPLCKGLVGSLDI